MRFVEVKSAEHHARRGILYSPVLRAPAHAAHPCTAWASRRVVAQGPANLAAVAGILADETNDLPEGVREIGQLYVNQIGLHTEKIEGLVLKPRGATKANEDLHRLCAVPGVGSLTAGAILAFAPDLPVL